MSRKRGKMQVSLSNRFYPPHLFWNSLVNRPYSYGFRLPGWFIVIGGVWR